MEKINSGGGGIVVRSLGSVLGKITRVHLDGHICSSWLEIHTLRFPCFTFYLIKEDRIKVPLCTCVTS